MNQWWSIGPIVCNTIHWVVYRLTTIQHWFDGKRIGKSWRICTNRFHATESNSFKRSTISNPSEEWWFGIEFVAATSIDAPFSWSLNMHDPMKWNDHFGEINNCVYVRNHEMQQTRPQQRTYTAHRNDLHFFFSLSLCWMQHMHQVRGAPRCSALPFVAVE